MRDKLKNIIQKSKEKLSSFKNKICSSINRSAFMNKASLGIKKSITQCLAFVKKTSLCCVSLVKKHKKKSIVVTVVFLAVVTVVALVCVRCSGNRQDDGQNEKGFGWGTGITENLPCFSENVDSFDQGEAYVAAYYSNVTSEQVSEYLAKLDEQCGIKFEGQQYPRSATLDDRVIAIHYNVTEMRFSVTVVAKDIGDDADIH